MQDFVAGLTAPWRGFKIILEDRALWPLAAAPTVITATLLFVALYGAITGAEPLILWLAPGLAQWPVLLLFARSAAILLLLLMFGGLATMTAALVCLPFHDALSQRVEALRGELPPPISFREALPLSIAHSVMGFVLWMVLETAIAPVQLVPGIGTILQVVLGWGLTAFFLAHQLLDGPLSRRRMGFGEKLIWMRAHLPAVLGLGTTGTVMVAIPLVNAVGLPIAIAGGTLLFVELGGSGPDGPGRHD